MRIACIFILATVLALLAASCSSDSESPQIASLESGTENALEDSEAAEADPIAETEEAMLAFSQCLRDQGIDIGDPTIDADGNVQLAPVVIAPEGETAGPDEGIEEMDRAMSACGEHLEVIAGTPGDLDDTEFEDNFLAYAQCMRDEGIDMPDPDFSSPGLIGELDIEINDEYIAADTACRHHLAFRGIEG